MKKTLKVINIPFQPLVSLHVLHIGASQMNIDLYPATLILRKDKRIQGTFKRALVIDLAGGISLIKESAKLIAAFFNRLDIISIVAKITGYLTG